MNVTCPQCATVFRVDPAKVPERGVRARCSVCAGLIAVRRPSPAEIAGPKQPAPEWAPEPPATPSLPRTAPARVAVPAAPPNPPTVETVRAVTPPPPKAAVYEPVRMAPPPPPVVPPEPVRTVAPPAPVPPVVEPLRPAAPPPAPLPVGTAPAAVPATPEPMARPNSPPSVTFSALPPDSPAPGPHPAPPARPSGSPFTNPFLQQDPSTRARRLARALISDLVVYHPEKRQRGLADGNLKELFAEEIRKSWEEYSEQVGDELASGTSYFTEALNEILSEGRQLFG